MIKRWYVKNVIAQTQKTSESGFEPQVGSYKGMQFSFSQALGALEPWVPRSPDVHGYELVSSVRALVPQKFSVGEELMHVKHVEVKSPHVGVMWKFGRIEEVVDLARHINFEMQNGDVKELLDFRYQEMTIDQLIEIHKHGIEELDTLDPVH
ncbi:hypothetical protein TNCV_3508201 [Trichonephila clavipes]|uniref:Uncharacterized protein n=1 Tax=Trichonephila clavipes TaxID=2585209 RepID=A0A8X6S1N1_TRICX|nr:hypothetical protein TNCV_3508201 [Trichonephila clavipes]